MNTTINNYARFLWRSARLATEGDWRYYAWVGLLFGISLLGLNAYARQLAEGLIATNMSDQVSWGVYIANFTFLVGVAAAAVIPPMALHEPDQHCADPALQLAELVCQRRVAEQ